MKKAILSLFVSFALAAPAFAQHAGRTDSMVASPDSAVDQSIQAAREAFRAKVKGERKALKTQLEETRDRFEQEVHDMRAKKANAIKRWEAQFKKDVATIRDEKKRTAVQHIDDEIVKLNDERDQRFTDILGKLDAMMTRIQAKSDTAKATGKDVAAVEQALSDARTAIDAARAAVKAQATNVYKITITTIGKLGAAVRATRNAVHDDLKKVEDAVKAARDAVQNAAIALGGTEDANAGNQSAPAAAPSAQ